MVFAEKCAFWPKNNFSSDVSDTPELALPMVIL